MLSINHCRKRRDGTCQLWPSNGKLEREAHLRREGEKPMRRFRMRACPRSILVVVTRSQD